MVLAFLLLLELLPNPLRNQVTRCPIILADTSFTRLQRPCYALASVVADRFATFHPQHT